MRDVQRELTQMGCFARGLHIHHHERRGERSDGNNPFQAAFERHLLSCRHGAGEAQYGHGCQCEASAAGK